MELTAGLFSLLPKVFGRILADAGIRRPPPLSTIWIRFGRQSRAKKKSLTKKPKKVRLFNPQPNHLS
jgi:hypothetical protein